MNYTDIAQTTAIIVTIVLFGIAQYFNIKSAHADSFIRINGEYNRMVTYRLDHPEVLETANIWRKSDLDKIGKVKEITTYYSYGGLCISFCSVCLYHRKKNLISRDDFENYYLGLINLVATENTAFFNDIASGKYCPQEFRDWFVKWEKNSRRVGVVLPGRTKPTLFIPIPAGGFHPPEADCTHPTFLLNRGRGNRAPTQL